MRHKIQASVESVIVVGRDGVARLDAERARCAHLLGRATPPEECGDAMPVAPARGPMIAMARRETVRGEDGRARIVETGYRGRKAARVADAFDTMTWAASRAAKGGVFVPPFTVGQVEMGREYASLVERVAAAGVKCASIEGVGGGGGGEGVQAAVFRDIERLRMLRRRVGHGPVKEIRRVRPGGAARRVIRALDLVEAVCVEGLSLKDVLRRHGWAVDRKCIDGLRTALCSALDRMRGFDLVWTAT